MICIWLLKLSLLVFTLAKHKNDNAKKTHIKLNIVIFKMTNFLFFSNNPFWIKFIKFFLSLSGPFFSFKIYFFLSAISNSNSF